MTGIKRGPAPGYGTLQCCLSQLNIASFEQELSAWAETVLHQQVGNTAYGGLVMDGKRLRGSKQGRLAGVHILSVLSHELGLVMGQQVVPTETNEHKVIIPLLSDLTLTVTTLPISHLRSRVLFKPRASTIIKVFDHPMGGD